MAAAEPPYPGRAFGHLLTYRSVLGVDRRNVAGAKPFHYGAAIVTGVPVADLVSLVPDSAAQCTGRVFRVASMTAHAAAHACAATGGAYILSNTPSLEVAQACAKALFADLTSQDSMKVRLLPRAAKIVAIVSKFVHAVREGHAPSLPQEEMRKAFRRRVFFPGNLTVNEWTAALHSHFEACPGDWSDDTAHMCYIMNMWTGTPPANTQGNRAPFRVRGSGARMRAWGPIAEVVRSMEPLPLEQAVGVAPGWRECALAAAATYPEKEGCDAALVMFSDACAVANKTALPPGSPLPLYNIIPPPLLNRPVAGSELFTSDTLHLATEALQSAVAHAGVLFLPPMSLLDLVASWQGVWDMLHPPVRDHLWPFPDVWSPALRRIVCVLNMNRNHWLTVVVDVHAGCVCVYNSLSSRNDAAEIKVGTALVQWAVRWDPRRRPARQWEVLVQPFVQQRGDATACGPLAMMAAVLRSTHTADLTHTLTMQVQPYVRWAALLATILDRLPTHASTHLRSATEFFLSLKA